jgi:hypothetical protein
VVESPETAEFERLLLLRHGYVVSETSELLAWEMGCAERPILPGISADSGLRSALVDNFESFRAEKNVGCRAIGAPEATQVGCNGVEAVPDEERDLFPPEIGRIRPTMEQEYRPATAVVFNMNRNAVDLSLEFITRPLLAWELIDEGACMPRC